MLNKIKIEKLKTSWQMENYDKNENEFEWKWTFVVVHSYVLIQTKYVDKYTIQLLNRHFSAKMTCLSEE